MWEAGHKGESGFRWAIVLSIIFLLSGCASSQTQPANTPVPTSDNIATVSAQPLGWKSDGTVSNDEYSQFQQIGDLQVFSRIAGDSVCLALRAQNNGYIALGIKPEDKMLGADMLICAMNGSQATVTDAYSTGTFGPHPADIELGGSNDVLESSGSQQNGWVTFEFKRKLKTGDSKDKELTIGDNPVIWSSGSSADISIHHVNRGYGILTLK